MPIMLTTMVKRCRNIGQCSVRVLENTRCIYDDHTCLLVLSWTPKYSRWAVGCLLDLMHCLSVDLGAPIIYPDPQKRR